MENVLPKIQVLCVHEVLSVINVYIVSRFIKTGHGLLRYAEEALTFSKLGEKKVKLTTTTPASE